MKFYPQIELEIPVTEKRLWKVTSGNRTAEILPESDLITSIMKYGLVNVDSITPLPETATEKDRQQEATS